MKIIVKLNQEAEEDKVKKFITKFLTYSNDTFSFDTMFLDYINSSYLKKDYSKPISNRERPVTVINNPFIEITEVDQNCSIKITKRKLNNLNISSFCKIPIEEWIIFFKENYKSWISSENNDEENERREKLKREREEREKQQPVFKSKKKIIQSKVSIINDKI